MNAYLVAALPDDDARIGDLLCVPAVSTHNTEHLRTYLFRKFQSVNNIHTDIFLGVTAAHGKY